MADFTRQSWTRPRIAVPRRPVDEEINPSSEWTNDFPGFHCLVVNLPGFNGDDIKLNVDVSGIIVVSGRRKVDDEKQEHFEKTFNVPEDGDVNSIKKTFDGATLRVRIPKVAKMEESNPFELEYKSGFRVLRTSDLNNNNALNEGKESPGKKEKSSKAKSPASSNGTKGTEIEAASDTNEQKKIASILKELEDEEQDSAQIYMKESVKIVNSRHFNPARTKQQPSKEADNEATMQYPNEPGQKEKSWKASVLLKIVANKGILLAFIISFTLGFLLSQQIHPSAT